MQEGTKVLFARHFQRGDRFRFRNEVNLAKTTSGLPAGDSNLSASPRDSGACFIETLRKVANEAEKTPTPNRVPANVSAHILAAMIALYGTAARG